ncbi:MAG: bi-domain-containing oxidoreductase [Candidatus Jorgensenbacteria bacterium]|nr:bi-domain-containing oxidoreductase [Candidatus Jorgensenbacteria bacterium]
MKQVFQNPKTGETVLEEVTPPPVRAGGVLVKNSFSVISAGTERSIMELSKKSILEKAKERPDYVQKFFMLMKTKGIGAAWRVAQSKLGTEIALGYSSAGRVVAVGAGVEGIKTGDKVACAGQNYASHAEWVFIPKNLIAKVPQGVSEEEAAFGTLGAIALQGIRQANLTPGERVGVVGLGLLGQLAVKMLHAYGHPVMGFDVNEAQVLFAKEGGMDEGVAIGKADHTSAVKKFTDGKGLDAILIYASAKTNAPLKLAVDLARDRGRVVQIGNVPSEIPWRDFYTKELSFISSRSYGPGRYDPSFEEGGHDYPFGYVRWTEKGNLEEFLRLLGEKKISVLPLITKTFSINEALRAYELVLKPKGLVHGIVLSYPAKGEADATMPLPATPRPSDEKKATVKIGLVGLGSFMNSTIIPHLKEIEGVEVRAICHPKGLPAKKTGIAAHAAYVTADYEKLLEDKEIDLIICATRHRSHAAMAVKALEANKNIYIEKPLALNEEELKLVMKAAERSKGRLLVGFNRRFSYHFGEAKKEFKNAKTPLVVLYRVNVGPLEASHWSYDPEEGGRLIGEGCHFIDALQFLIGSRPTRIAVSRVPAGGAVPHEENFTINVEYENGSLGTVVYTALGNFRLPKEYIEIYGDGKIMVIDNFKDGKVIEGNRTRNVSQWHQNKGYTEEIRALVEAITTGGPSPMSLEELSLSHLATFKAAEALRTGQVISFSE